MADQASEGLLSPFLRNQRFSAARPFLNGKVLDVGCGTGMLAGEIPAQQYLGIEIDDLSLKQAINGYPDHQFLATLDDNHEKFDTIISLAVIEHVKNPAAFLKDLASRLTADDKARVIITTPHPSMDWIHDVGSSLGFFSKHANDEHEDLLDKEKLNSVGQQAGLKFIEYKRFLFGANQLAVYAKA